MVQFDRMKGILAFEVEQLPQNKPLKKGPTGLLERTHERRERQHQALYTELQERLRTIATEAQEAILKSVHNLQGTITVNDVEIRASIENNDATSLAFFEELDRTIVQTMGLRREQIEFTMHETEKIEGVRYEKITDIFNEIVPKMMIRSHMKCNDVSRLMEQELLSVNQILLRNRRVYIELYRRLMLDALYKERQYFHRLNLNRNDWKKMVVAEAVRTSAEELNALFRKCGEEVTVLLLSFEGRLAGSRSAMLSTLQEIVQLVPPNVTSVTLREWLRRTTEATSVFFWELVGDVDEVRGHYDEITYSFRCLMMETGKTLEKNLRLTQKAVQSDYVEHCLQNCATLQAQAENDFQFYTLKILKQRDLNMKFVDDLYDFIHGAVWQWEVHTTGIARAEDFLDCQLQKHRAAVQTQLETKINVRLKTALDVLRYSSNPSTNTAQVHACEVVLADLEKLLQEAWKKMCQTINGTKMLCDILARGYQQRLFAYMQVALKSEQDVEEPNNSQRQPATSGTQAPANDFTSGGRRLPDVPLEAYEKKVLKEIGLTPADEENVGLRLKTIPAYENDPRGTPPEATITTKTGLLFEPSSVDLAICQRFSKEKEAKRDPRDALQARMTESQMDCTASMSFETPEHSGLVTLTPLMEYLSTEMDAERIFSLHRQNFRENMLCHAVDEWEGALADRVNRFLDCKKELCETELQLRMRCFSTRIALFQRKIQEVRNAELTEHEDRYKEMEVVLNNTVADWKSEIAQATRQLTDKAVPVRDNLSKIEKAFFNATRVGHVVQLKQQAQDQSSASTALTTSIFSDIRDRLHDKLQKVMADCRTAVSSFKKSTDGGTYSPEDQKHYGQLWQKLMEKVATSEKSLTVECTTAELKRKQLLDSLTAKALERVSHHEMDLQAISKIAQILEKAQSGIKSQAAVLNAIFTATQKILAVVVKQCDALELHSSEKNIPSDQILDNLQAMLHHFRDCCSKLGSLTRENPPPKQEIPVPDASFKDPPKASKKGARPSSRKSTVAAPAPAPPPATVTDPSTDFQIVTPEGPLPLVTPRPFIPVDVKSVTSNQNGSNKDSPGIKKKGRLSVIAAGVSAASSANLAQKKNKRLERYFIFGECPMTNPETFLEMVCTICWQSLNDTLDAGEEYHRLRGNRPITRPHLLLDSVDSLAERLCKKLLNYQTQSENFANYLVDKLRDLALQTVTVLCKLPLLLGRQLLRSYNVEMNLLRRLFNMKFAEQCEAVRNPCKDVTFAHFPQEVLRENDVDHMLKIICDNICREWSHGLTELTSNFLTKLINLHEKLFSLYDSVLTPADIKRSSIPPHTTLLRPPSPAASPESFDQCPKLWKALQLEAIPGILSNSISGRDVECLKTTMAHLAADDARHRVFKEYLDLYDDFCNETKKWQMRPVDPNITNEKREFQEFQLKRLEALGLMRTERD